MIRVRHSDPTEDAETISRQRTMYFRLRWQESQDTNHHSHEQLRLTEAINGLLQAMGKKDEKAAN